MVMPKPYFIVRYAGYLRRCRTLTEARREAQAVTDFYGSNLDSVQIRKGIDDDAALIVAWLRRSPEGDGTKWYWATN
jgi:hypothetical protein